MTLIKEKFRLEELMADSGHRVNKWLELSEKTFDFACTARKQFTEGGNDIKKQILLAIGSNLTLKDKTISIEAKKPFLIFEESTQGGRSAFPSIEPGKDGSAQGRNTLSNDSSPHWRPYGESNPDYSLEKAVS